MILCPSCQYQEIDGSLFCSECGARLVTVEIPTTQNIQRSQTGHVVSQSRPPIAAPNTSPNLARIVISLHLIESGMILHLSEQMEYTIGRMAEGQPLLPDVDLSPYEAYAQGVSRLHAIVKINQQRVYITDLGSSNGTRVNGQKIMSNTDYPLNHGDVIALGKFKIQVLIRK
jgi:pSer/pThr/pTyr-binding forkhead associated (FHA) protein